MEKESELIFNTENEEIVKDFFRDVMETGSNFKLQKNFRKTVLTPTEIQKEIVTDLNDEGVGLGKILEEFKETILPNSSNFGSKKFMGFPDAGNSVAGIGGAILSDFLQQNLINQSFCAPAATFVEIAVIKWLRKTVGYSNKNEILSVWDVGGIVTNGGTLSNSIAMMLARENKVPGTMETGITNPDMFKIVVPKGIGHYSVKSAQRWLGCGNNLIEVPTINFKYDLKELEKVLLENKDNIMAVVAYAGDSRTMTIDDLEAIAKLVKRIDSKIWLHADACHGFCLGFSNSLKYKIKGIEEFDSVSLDPHKVLLVPYTLSAILIKNPENFKKITSLSDLIMQESFAFGQITPFIGSKSWISLKLWFMMKNFGWTGLDRLITKRHNTAKIFASMVNENKNFKLINEVDLNAVAFMYTGDKDEDSIENLNFISKEIHKRMLEEGKFHLHQFSIPDPGIFREGEIIYPLRFMSGNPNLTRVDMKEILEYIVEIAHKCSIKQAHAVHC